MQLISQLQSAVTSLSTATAVTLPNSNAGYALTALQVFLSTAQVDDKSPALDFLKGKDATVSVSSTTATLLNYVPPLIILLHYLLPYLSAYKAGNLTGTLLKMSSKGTGSLVKNGRECLIAVMLLGHFLRKLVESASCKNPTPASKDGSKRIVSGITHALTCYVITTVSETVPASSLSTYALYGGLAIFGVGEFGNMIDTCFHPNSRKSVATEEKKNGKTPLVISDIKSLFNKIKGEKADVPISTSSSTSSTTSKNGVLGSVSGATLFKLMVWLGIAIVSQNLNVYLVFTTMCQYLLNSN